MKYPLLATNFGKFVVGKITANVFLVDKECLVRFRPHYTNLHFKFHISLGFSSLMPYRNKSLSTILARSVQRNTRPQSFISFCIFFILFSFATRAGSPQRREPITVGPYYLTLCQLSLWEETRSPGENPRLSAERQL